MPRLLSPSGRQRLTKEVLRALKSTPFSSSELASLTGQRREAISVVLVALAGRGLIEPIGRVLNPFGSEILWRLGAHHLHDPRARLPGTPRCRHCRPFRRP